MLFRSVPALANGGSIFLKGLALGGQPTQLGIAGAGTMSMDPTVVWSSFVIESGYKMQLTKPNAQTTISGPAAGSFQTTMSMNTGWTQVSVTQFQMTASTPVTYVNGGSASMTMAVAQPGR